MTTPPGGPPDSRGGAATNDAPESSAAATASDSDAIVEAAARRGGRDPSDRRANTAADLRALRPEWTDVELEAWFAETDAECAEADRLDDEREAAERAALLDAWKRPTLSPEDYDWSETTEERTARVTVDAALEEAFLALQADTGSRVVEDVIEPWTTDQQRAYVASLDPSDRAPAGSLGQVVAEYVAECADRELEPDAAVLVRMSEAWTGAEQPATVEAAVARVVERNAPLDWSTVWESAHADVQWVAEPLVEAGTSVALYSAPKVGKSLLLLDICAAIASGRPVLGKPAAEPRRVLYLDAENTTADLVERLTAMGYDPADRLVYVSFPDLAPIDTAAGGAAVVALAEAHKPELVVFDTISRFVEGKEDASDTWNAVYRCTLQHLKSRGIAVLRLDHAGKDAERGMRGSSSKASDVDTVWRLEPVSSSQHDGHAVRLVRTHTRNGHGDDKVLLARLTEPLRHLPTGKRVLDDSGQPLVTPVVQRILDALDRLEVPAAWGREKAAKALAEAGVKAGNDNLAEALKVRRLRPGRGAPLPDPLGDHLSGTVADRSGQVES